MARKAKKRAPVRMVRRRQSRVERQRRIKNIIVWSAVGVAVVVVGLLLYGLVIDRLVKQQQPVAIVNGATITVGDVQARAHLYDRLYYRRFYGQPLPVEEIGFVVDMLIRAKLVRQEAARREIGVTPEEVQQDILLGICGYDPEAPTPEPTLGALNVGGTPVPQATAVTAEGTLQACDADLREAGIEQGTSNAQLRADTEETLLREALRDEMGESVPAEEDQVQLRYIEVYTPGDAAQLFGRLEGGEPFETLQEEVGSEEGIPGFVVDLEWYLVDELEGVSPEVAVRAFDLEATGVFTEAAASMSGSMTYYVVEVTAHEVRELSDEQRQMRAGQLFNEWLDSQMVLVERLEYDPANLMPAP